MSSSLLRTASLVCVALSLGAKLPAQDAVATVGADPAPVPLEAGASSVRIVRLSQARGGVQMDRNTGRGFETAFANIPVVAGATLRTTDGVAEVEFEDNSTLRLAPGAEVRVLQLSRTATGLTETTVSVAKGLVYVGLEKTKGAMFSLEDGPARVELAPGAHVRLDATHPEAELAVFDGGATLHLAGVTTSLAKRQTVQLNPAAQTVSAVARGTQEGDWDGWDKQAVDYHHQKAGLAGSGGFGLYGANDLNYYGSFVDMPGCGSMWRPYLASASFDPFANGVWAFYPGAGYSWVSPYPWGWLPFHSGSWAQCGAGGWGWRPSGGTWLGLSNAPVMRIARHPLPHPVPAPPMRGGSTLVPVNTRPLTMSGVSGGSTFMFRRDSAGLGVPRQEFGSLRGVANHVERHGMATTTMAPSAVSAYTPGAALANRGSLGPGAPGTPGAPRSAAAPSASNSSMHTAAPSMHSSAPSMSAPNMSGPRMSAPSMSSPSMSAGGARSGGGGSAGKH